MIKIDFASAPPPNFRAKQWIWRFWSVFGACLKSSVHLTTTKKSEKKHENNFLLNFGHWKLYQPRVCIVAVPNSQQKYMKNCAHFSFAFSFWLTKDFYWEGHFSTQTELGSGKYFSQTLDFPKCVQLWRAVSPSSMNIFSKFEKIMKGLCLNFQTSLIRTKTGTYRKR